MHQGEPPTGVCLTSAEKIWRAAEIAIEKQVPMILQAAGGGARMHTGCSSMVSIPKAQLAITRVERAGLKVITIITDPTLGGVAIGYGSRGIRLFESGAGNIGFSGKRVVEQYVGHPVSKEFQKTSWLMKNGHAEHICHIKDLRNTIVEIISENPCCSYFRKHLSYARECAARLRIKMYWDVRILAHSTM